MYHLTDFCRLCLDFSGEFNNMCNDDIMEKVVACINGLEFDEKLPALICNKCSEQLDKFFDFRNQCLRSEFLLNCYIAKLSCLQSSNKFVNTQLKVNVLKNFTTSNESLGNVQISKKRPVKQRLNNDNAKDLGTFNSEILTSSNCSSDFRNCNISEDIRSSSNTNLKNSSETDIELNSSHCLSTKPKTNTFVMNNDVNAYLSDEDDVFLEEEDDEIPQLENVNKALNSETKNVKRKLDNSNNNSPNKKTRLETNSQEINGETSATRKVNFMNSLERDAEFLAFSMQGDITEHVKLRKRKVQIRAQAKIEQALRDKVQLKKRNQQLFKNTNLYNMESPSHPKANTSNSTTTFTIKTDKLITDKLQNFNKNPVKHSAILDKLVDTRLKKSPSKLKFLELHNFDNITATHSLNTASKIKANEIKDIDLQDLETDSIVFMINNIEEDKLEPPSFSQNSETSLFTSNSIASDETNNTDSQIIGDDSLAQLQDAIYNTEFAIMKNSKPPAVACLDKYRQNNTENYNTLSIDLDTLGNSSANQTVLNETLYSEQPTLKSDLATGAISTYNTKVSRNLKLRKITTIKGGKIIAENVEDASVTDSKSHKSSTDLQNCTQNEVGLQTKTVVDFEKSIPTFFTVLFGAKNKLVSSKLRKASEDNETCVQNSTIPQLNPLIATTTSSHYSDRSLQETKKLLSEKPAYKPVYKIINPMSNNALHNIKLTYPILRRVLPKYSSSSNKANANFFRIKNLGTVSNKTNAVGNKVFEDSINDSLNVATNLEIPLYDTNALIKNSLLEMSNHDSIHLPNVPENIIVAPQSKADINSNPTCQYASFVSRNDNFKLTNATEIFEPLQHTELKPALIYDGQSNNNCEGCVTLTTVSKNCYNPYTDHNYAATSRRFFSSKTPPTSSAKFQSCSNYNKDAKCNGKIKKKSASKRRNRLLPDNNVQMKRGLICKESKYIVDDPLNILKLFKAGATRSKRSKKKCKKRIISKSSEKDKLTHTGKSKRRIPVRKAEDSNKLEDSDIDVETVSEPFNYYNISCYPEEKEVTLAKTLEKHRRIEIRKYLNILHTIILDKNIQPSPTLSLKETVNAAILCINNLKIESEVLLKQHLDTLHKQNTLINKFKALKEEAETKDK